MDDMTIRTVEIAKRIGQLETNIVTERTARMESDHPDASYVRMVDRHKMWESLASWTHLRRILQHRTVGQEADERHEELTETPVMNVGEAADVRVHQRHRVFRSV